MTPGGDVIVVGDPHLIEEVGRWEPWRRNVLRICEFIRRDDVAMLRSVTGYLNEQIALAVLAADQRHRADSVRFHCLDISRDPYEYSGNASDRHGLCSQDPWLNGATTGLGAGDLDIRVDRRFNNSFHPRQAGHTNTARVLAAYLRAQLRFDDAPAQAASPGEAAEAVASAISSGQASIATGVDDVGLVNAYVGANGAVPLRNLGCFLNIEGVAEPDGSYICYLGDPSAPDLAGVPIGGATGLRVVLIVEQERDSWVIRELRPLG